MYPQSFANERKSLENFDTRLMQLVTPQFVETLSSRNVENSKKLIQLLDKRAENLLEFYLKKRLTRIVVLSSYYDDLTILINQEKLFLNNFYTNQLWLDLLLKIELASPEISTLLKKCTTSEIIEYFEKAKVFSKSHGDYSEQIFAPFQKIIAQEYPTLEKKYLLDSIKNLTQLTQDSIQKVFETLEKSLHQWISVSQDPSIVSVLEIVIDEYAKQLILLVGKVNSGKKSTSSSLYDRDWTNVEDAVRLYEMLQKVFSSVTSFDSGIKSLFGKGLNVKNVKLLREHVEKHLNEVLFQNVADSLKGFSDLTIWKEEKVSKPDLPTVNPPPQAYMSQITEYHVTLPGHLVFEEDSSLIMHSMNVLCHKTADSLTKGILNIKKLKKDGLQQLVADLTHLNQILSVLEIQNTSLGVYIGILSAKDDEVMKLDLDKEFIKVRDAIMEIRSNKRK